VALLSDIDWLILLVAAAFLLFGNQNTELLRTLGRWYGRAGRLKQELLSEFTRAADLPPPGPGAPLSIRGALLGLDGPNDGSAPVRGVPAAVARPAPAPPTPHEPAPGWPPWSGGYPTATWSMTVPIVPSESEVAR
jgi:hypothetical protein